jgi:hypothetical protein
VTIAEIQPAIWREIGVPSRYSLHQLHRVLQLAFGWLDYHLYAFEVEERRFEEPGDEAEDEDSTRVRLSDLELRKGSKLTYTYDFGDDWVHEIRVVTIAPLSAHEAPHALPRILGGANAGPPEDAGGAPGFADLLVALRDPRHPEHASSRMWAGEEYDPSRFDAWITDRHVQLTAAWGAV